MTDRANRPDEARPQLERRLGTADAVVMGLGSMIGAGVFAALAPAAAAAGTGLLIGLAAAAVVAYFNATSTARCAARYPESGGAYVYGRKRLGEFWGYLAGWGFVVGKTASCAAMALIVGFYAWPAQAHAIAVVAVIALTALNCTGIQKSVRVTRIIVTVVLAALTASCGRRDDGPAAPTSAESPSAPTRASTECCRRQDCCFLRSPVTRESRPWVRRCATRRAPFPARFRWRWASR